MYEAAIATRQALGRCFRYPGLYAQHMATPSCFIGPDPQAALLTARDPNLFEMSQARCLIIVVRLMPASANSQPFGRDPQRLCAGKQSGSVGLASQPRVFRSHSLSPWSYISRCQGCGWCLLRRGRIAAVPRLRCTTQRSPEWVDYAARCECLGSACDVILYTRPFYEWLRKWTPMASNRLPNRRAGTIPSG